MGRIKIQFFANGINLENDPTSIKWGKVQSLQRKYSTSKMQEIEVASNDFYFDFDIDQISGVIDWGNLNYPNETIKGKILEIIYYGEKSQSLGRILEKIRNSNNSYDIENLGHESVEIIKSIADSTFFSSLKLFQDSSIGNIEYTINKEVKKAGRYGLSTRQKNEAMNDAKNKLSWDIKEFKLRLDNFDVNG